MRGFETFLPLVKLLIPIVLPCLMEIGFAFVLIIEILGLPRFEFLQIKSYLYMIEVAHLENAEFSPYHLEYT